MVQILTRRQWNRIWKERSQYNKYKSKELDELIKIAGGIRDRNINLVFLEPDYYKNTGESDDGVVSIEVPARVALDYMLNMYTGWASDERSVMYPLPASKLKKALTNFITSCERILHLLKDEDFRHFAIMRECQSSIENTKTIGHMQDHPCLTWDERLSQGFDEFENKKGSKHLDDSELATKRLVRAVQGVMLLQRWGRQALEVQMQSVKKTKSGLQPRKRPDMAFTYYVYALCCIWNQVFLKNITTSVSKPSANNSGSAGGKLIEFISYVLKYEQMPKSNEAIRAKIRELKTKPHLASMCLDNFVGAWPDMAKLRIF